MNKVIKYIKSGLSADDKPLGMHNSVQLINLAETMVDHGIPEKEVIEHLDNIYKALKSHFLDA